MLRRCTSLAIALAALAPGPAQAGSWLWPVEGEVIGHYRNGDDRYSAGQHRGIDISASEGTPVVAAVGGRVMFAGGAAGSGLTVTVRAEAFDTSYLHLSSVAVREGQALAAGARIGTVGTSGRRSTAAPHLHFSVREAGTRHAYRDPLDFLGARDAPPPAGPVGPAPRPPAGAPVPAAPRSPAPSRSRAPKPVPAPRRVPGGAPRPAPGWVRGFEPVLRSVPVPAPAAARRAARGPSPAPARRVGAEKRARAGSAEPRPAPAPRPGPAPRLGAAPRGSVGFTADGAVGPTRPRPPEAGTVKNRAGEAGDPGWIAACAGLVAVALMLGRGGLSRRAPGSGRSERGAAAQPQPRPCTSASARRAAATPIAIRSTSSGGGASSFS